MATQPLVLVNGTTADADEVMDLFDEIYGNIDESNVQAGNKTGSGKFVLQTSPTFSSTTTISETGSNDPTLSYTISAGTTWYAGLDNSDSDKYKVGTGSTVGTNVVFIANYGGSGADNSTGVYNENNTASSGAYHEIYVGGTSAADPRTLYTIVGGTTWHVGSDNSDSDKLKIGTGTTVGTNVVVISSHGGSGADNWSGVYNENNTASSGAYHEVYVGGTSAGDPRSLYTVQGGTTWYAGLDNSDSDAYKLGSGTTVGTNLVFKAFHGGSGAANYLMVTNENNTASSDAYFEHWVAGTSAGDPKTLYTVQGSTTWYAGLDNSDSDIYKIGTGTTVGTNTLLTLNASGEMLLPSVDPPTANYANRNSFVKAWGRFDSSGATTSAYNCSCTYSGAAATGYTVTWATDFATADYAVVGNIDGIAGFTRITATVAGSCNVILFDTSGTATTADFSIIACGVQ